VSGRPHTPITVQVYEAEDGSRPYQEWSEQLDPKTRAKVNARIAQVRAGSLGDHKRLTDADGVCELRIHSGPGYRIYYGMQGNEFVLLLEGSIKRDQKAAIAKAIEYWKCYKQTKN